MNAVNNVYRLCKRGIDGKRCNRPLGEHVEGRCPFAKESRHVFHPSKSDSKSSSNSFTEPEVEWLHTMVTLLMRGGDTRSLARHSAFAGVARKALAMTERVKARKARASRETEVRG